MEILRAELSRAKEQARMSNAATEKVAAELKAEQSAQRRMPLADAKFLRKITKPKRRS